ncbi:Chibby family [Trinorchestia longiramus]|nr:Chibby family [Trinorchestia longiramus]
MPLRFFSRGRSPSKKLSRRSSSLSALSRSADQLPSTLAQDYNRIDLKLSEDQRATYEDGAWRVSGSGDVGTAITGKIVHADQKLLKKIKSLEEENRKLRLKTELLLDMLTEKSAEHQMTEQALKQLRLKCNG